MDFGYVTTTRQCRARNFEVKASGMPVTDFGQICAVDMAIDALGNDVSDLHRYRRRAASSIRPPTDQVRTNYVHVSERLAASTQKATRGEAWSSQFARQSS